MAEPKAYESERLTSGVTWKWKKTISDYPASEWTLTYYLRKDGATATSFSAAADGDSYLVTVAATQKPDDWPRGKSVRRLNAGHLSARSVSLHRARINFRILCLNSETGAFGFSLDSTEVHVGGAVQHRAVVAPGDVGDVFAGDEAAEQFAFG